MEAEILQNIKVVAQHRGSRQPQWQNYLEIFFKKSRAKYLTQSKVFKPAIMSFELISPRTRGEVRFIMKVSFDTIFGSGLHTPTFKPFLEQN